MKVKTKIPSFIKAFLMLIVSYASFTDKSFSQCTNSSPYSTAAAPTNTTPYTISTCTYQEEYNTITGVAASTTYSSSNSAGGCITVHQGTPGGPVVGFGSSPLSWTSTVAGTYYIHYTVSCSPCTTTTGCTTTTITCTSCGSGGGNPCSSITSIPSCGTSVTASMTGVGAGWSPASCGFSTPGQEVIYSFTPTVTGTYSINVTAASGGYVDFFWVNSTSGCSSTAGWNCISDVSFTGTYGSMSWTAGQTYYILVDPESTSAYSYTFNIPCISAGGNPCSSVTNIVGCGASYSASVSGTGSWNNFNCGWSTPGLEVLYTYTPTTSGNHAIVVTALSGSIVDFAYMPVSNGCVSTGWTCIDDFIFTGTSPTFFMTAGVQYYILADIEGTGATSFTFGLDCPGSAVTASDCTAAVNICSNASFQIDPNGYGATMEIPALGTVGNPYNNNPGGSGNDGCLQSFVPENNSTWMVINVATSGDLEFSFGAGGAQAGYYDWIMYPYNATACANIPSGNYAPVRCNWNWTSSGGTGCAGTIPSGGNAGNYEPPLAVLAGEQYVICFSNYSSASTSVPLDFFGTATVSCTPLNAELMNFDGSIVAEGIFLNWTTNSEVNSSHFTIERSDDGISYQVIGTVSANGNSNQQIDYSFLDEKPNEGMNYYRLVSVDMDNSAQTSKVLNFDYTSSLMDIFIHPNPTADLFNLSFELAHDTPLEIDIIDIAGKLIYHSKIDAVSGKNSIQIPTHSIADGFYNLRVTNTSTRTSTISRVYKQQ